MAPLITLAPGSVEDVGHMMAADLVLIHPDPAFGKLMVDHGGYQVGALRHIAGGNSVPLLLDCFLTHWLRFAARQQVAGSLPGAPVRKNIWR
jgi:hypothetical protein